MNKKEPVSDVEEMKNFLSELTDKQKKKLMKFVFYVLFETHFRKLMGSDKKDKSKKDKKKDKKKNKNKEKVHVKKERISSPEPGNLYIPSYFDLQYPHPYRFTVIDNKYSYL